MSDLDRQILGSLGDLSDVAAVVLFGSRAKGTARADSDLDVAVLPARDLTKGRRQLQTRIAVALADLASGGRVDVVLLDEAPELLRQRVLEGGRLLHCSDEKAWKDLRVRTMREHGDREWVRELLRRGLHRRLTEGSVTRDRDQGGSSTEGRRHGRSARAVESLERLGKLSG